MTPPGDCVLDASALLAMLHAEPGSETVEAHLDRAAMSSVTWSEVVQKSLQRAVDVDGMRQDLEALGLAILPFDADDAEATARLWPILRGGGLSLGDRACIALAARLRLPVLTADEMWEELELEIRINVIR